MIFSIRLYLIHFTIINNGALNIISYIVVYIVYTCRYKFIYKLL